MLYIAIGSEVFRKAKIFKNLTAAGVIFIFI